MISLSLKIDCLSQNFNIICTNFIESTIAKIKTILSTDLLFLRKIWALEAIFKLKFWKK